MSFFATGGGPTVAARAVMSSPAAPPVIPPYVPPPAMAQSFVVAEITYRRPGSAPRSFDLATGEAPTGAVSRRPFQPELNGILRAADLGYITRPGDAPGQVVYPPTLSAGWAISRTARLEPWSGAGAVSWGSLRVIALDGRYDALVASCTPDGRPVRILRGTKSYDHARGLLRDPSYADLVPVFSGVGDGLWRRGESEIELDLRDASYQGERPIQTALYGGAGGYDGTPEIKGRPKPICRGGTPAFPVCNVTPVLVDPLNRVYQWNDGPGALIQLYERGGAVFTFAGDTTNLYAGTTPSGSYRTDRSRGLFQLGAPAQGAITADVTGAFPSGAMASTPATIARLILTETLAIDGQFLDLGSLIGLEAARPWTAGLYLTEATDAMAVVDGLLRSLNAWLAPARDGRLRVTRMQAPGTFNPVAAYGPGQIVKAPPSRLPNLLSPPPFRIRLAHSRRHTTQASDWAGAATDARKQLLAEPWSYATWVSGANIAAFRKQNDPPPIETMLLNPVEAQQVVEEIGAILGVRRAIHDLELPMYLAPRHEIGDEIVLDYPAAAIPAGTRAVVIGDSLDSTRATFVLTVLL
nr:hypothetical protein [uncultured Roseococcus sp.]